MNKRLLSFILLCFLNPLLFSQTQTITIGTANTTNTNTTYPAPYGNWYFGAKHQFLILASELSAAGMTAGNIYSVSFDVVQANGTPLQNFTIGMDLTTVNSLSNFINSIPSYYTSSSYTETNGWNTHTLSTPFYWDGTSNIVIETCFNNNSYTFNAVVNQTNTPFNSSIYYNADVTNVCSAPGFAVSATTRPVIQFSFQGAQVPPTTNFTQNTTAPCNGMVSFTDLSTGTNITSWYWDFGDGDTSNLQNPIHTYTTNGTYSVTLITCNNYGCDTLVVPNLISVNLSGNTPIAANCYPQTINGTLGFGITNVTLNTINNNSADASAGYEDFTCYSTNLTAGQQYTLSVTHDQPTNHNCAAWIDYNNDGVFDDVNERILTNNSALYSSVTFVVPSTAVQNTPLRLRVSADYDFSALPTPCSDLDYGQAEDYTVVIDPNTNPPTANFSAEPIYSCSNTINFSDLSLNIPITWQWDFGDGTTSNIQNPTHTYTSDGVYTVTLIVCNNFGCDTLTQTNYITINTAGAVAAASCTPQTVSYCCGYGIYQVSFNTINNITNDGIDGYQDYSCQHQTTVYAGNSYTLTVKTGINNPQDTRVWIDYNNDGAFSATELVMDSPNNYNPSANILIPSNTVLHTPLRMRVRSDVVSTPKTACDAPTYGQIEDYAIIVDTLPSLPTADFTANIVSTCNDSIQFYDLSTGVISSWLWNFGDGATSTLQNPKYKYPLSGIYNVSLVVTNISGSDSEIKYNFITINCDTAEIPDVGNIVDSSCSNYIFDDGRYLDYSNNTDAYILIQPSGASPIQLTFSQFDFLAGDTLFVYDGNNLSSATLLGAFSGNTMPPTVTASTGSMLVRQKTDNSGTAQGFIAQWSCSNSINEINTASISVYPNPVKDVLFINNPKNLFINRIEVTSIDGKRILEKPLSSQSLTKIVLSKALFSNGIYFLKAYTKDNQIIVKKFIIQR